MAIRAHIIDSDERVTEHTVESGASLAVAGDQRVNLPDIESADAALGINAADVLTVSIANATALFPGLLTHIENETGSELSFADGVAVDALGPLLARVSLSDASENDSQSGLQMADLIHDDLEVGDLLYLDEISDLGSLSHTESGEQLELSELVEAASERDALFGALDDVLSDPASTAHAADLWVNTEYGEAASASAVHHPSESDIIDPLISVDDGIA